MRAFAFFGDSGAGKTTLIERLVTAFAHRGLRSSTIKHAHHGFDLDRPGKDSWRFREAGALEVLIASDRHWALMGHIDARHDQPDRDPDLSLQSLLNRLAPCEVVLVEGFRASRLLPSVYVERTGRDVPRAAAKQTPAEVAARPGLCAWVTDCLEPTDGLERRCPRFHLDDIDGLADYLLSLPPTGALTC